MLKEMTIKNFKSINKEITFSMEADIERVSEYPQHIIDINNNKLLKVASMYGPNGGGKTNLLSALNLVKMLVLSGGPFPIASEASWSCSFNNDDVISMTLFFVTPKYEIGYSFDVLYKNERQEIMDFTGNKNALLFGKFEINSEILVYKATNDQEYNTLFERDDKGHITSERLDKITLQYANTINNSLTALLYFYNTFVNYKAIKDPELEVILSLYNEIFNIYELEVNGNVNYDVAFKAIEKNKERLVSLLNDVDIKISDIIIQQEDKMNPIKFERTIMINGKEEKKLLPLAYESKGTKKIFWMLLNLLNEKERSHIYYCDDMNAYLHPKLFKAIIEIFNSEENKMNQLIFNSHDIINMTNELFRRDEIWFVYRDEDYSTRLTPLSNIVNYKGEQVRKDAKYFKQYLEGRYGADPFIKKGLGWNE